MGQPVDEIVGLDGIVAVGLEVGPLVHVSRREPVDLLVDVVDEEHDLVVGGVMVVMMVMLVVLDACQCD